ncbi:hypothetical protein DPMN_089811 [Dreissena polymorpha]|uniref:Uncharacterized protein n=1 Tax=Dreissena polymorpha TaxID=45954 RepID=A0A9D4KWM3_DREPO|nr:hypothetical protein DPMN_089811 [Dreissena polymorpha]
MSEPNPSDSDSEVLIRQRTNEDYEDSDNDYVQPRHENDIGTQERDKQREQQPNSNVNQQIAFLMEMVKIMAKDIQDLKESKGPEIRSHYNFNDNQSRRCNPAEDLNHCYSHNVTDHNNGLQQESQQVFNYYGSTPMTPCEQDWCEGQHNVVNSREIHNKRYQHNSVNRPENQYSVNNIWYQQNKVNSGNQFRGPVYEGHQSIAQHQRGRMTPHYTESSLRQPRTHHIRMPPFTGKEGWETWRAQFEAIANRYGWDEEERLNQLLPRLEGAAAQSVFSQLSPHVLNHYHELLKEIDSRFRVIEAPRTFAAKLIHRSE